MTDYRNFPMVPRVIFGRGSFSQIGEIIEHKRTSETAPFIFLVDDVFQSDDTFISSIPLKNIDKNLLMLSDTKGITLTIGREELEEYKRSVASLFLEIFSVDIPFEEKSIV